MSNALSVTIIAAPAATDDNYTVPGNTASTIATPGVLNNDSDSDGGTLTAAVVTGPTHAAAFMLNSDGSFSYTPVTGYHGADSFTYQAVDGTETATPPLSALRSWGRPLPTISR